MAFELQLRPAPGEPPVEAWDPIATAGLAQRVVAACGEPDNRPAVIAVDGRSGAGKTTVANTLQKQLVDAAVVHTDDVAWYESFFGWDGLLRDHVLRPARQGLPVSCRPPAWNRRARTGAITVPVGAAFVVIEGCGAARRSLSAFLDCAIWVQSDHAEAERRGLLRDGGTAEAARLWREWAAQEVPFFAADQPWTRADFIICGTPGALPPGADLLFVEGQRSA